MRPAVFPTLLTLVLMLAGCANDATPSLPLPPPSSQDGLWTVSGSVSQIVRLDPTQLADTGQRDPATSLTTPSALLHTLAGVAFDAAGTLWIASEDDSLLLAFAPDALAGSGRRPATTVITPSRGSLNGPIGLAFDQRHRLWVANDQSATVIRFDTGQLTAGGALTPAVVLSVPGTPVAIAFDAAGSLWVCDNQFHLIYKYTAAQLAASGSPPPALILTGGGALLSPTGLAFDAAGTLWVANNGRNSLVAFSPAQLAGSGPSAPAIVISSNGGSLSIPLGLAFDGDGGLWIIGGTGVLTRLAPASLSATGAPAPDARLRISGRSVFWSLAFWPKPAGPPLN